MLKQFPDVSPIDFRVQAEVKGLTRSHPDHGDFQFTSLWAWDSAGAVAILNGNLVVKFNNSLAGRAFYSFCGAHRLGATASELLDYASYDGMSPELRLIPEPEALALRELGFVVEEDGGRFDYLMDAELVASMRGNGMARKRHAANHFERMREHMFRDIDLTDRSTRAAIQGLRYRLPSAERDIEVQLWSNSLDADWPALARLLLSSERFDTHSIGLYTANTLAGFAIWEHSGGSLGQVHFLKADYRGFPGATEALLRETARRMHAVGIKIFNYGCDDGIPGLRAAKKQFMPVSFVRKYTVRPARTSLE